MLTLFMEDLEVTDPSEGTKDDLLTGMGKNVTTLLQKPNYNTVGIVAL